MERLISTHNAVHNAEILSSPSGEDSAGRPASQPRKTRRIRPPVRSPSRICGRAQTRN